MNEENNQLKKVIQLIHNNVEQISQNSCTMLEERNIKDKDIYDSIYKINQDAHEILNVVNTYYDKIL